MSGFVPFKGVFLSLLLTVFEKAFHFFKKLSQILRMYLDCVVAFRWRSNHVFDCWAVTLIVTI